MTADTMRERFVAIVCALLDSDPNLAVVLAEIGASQFGSRAHKNDRVINVGIREQLMIGVTAGLALSGLRPIAHSYAPFLVERPYEQVKVDLTHQDLGAVLVSIGASYDWAAGGRTHEAPEDISLIASLPGWTIYVPGHPDEAELLLRAAVADNTRVYLRLSEQANRAPQDLRPAVMHVIRSGPEGSVIAVGPTLDDVLEATSDLDVTVLYATTVRPFDRATLRRTLRGSAVALVEPYLAGTSAAEISAALVDVPHRLLCIGVGNLEHRRYGTWADHNRAHELDAASLRRRLCRFFESATTRRGASEL